MWVCGWVCVSMWVVVCSGCNKEKQQGGQHYRGRPFIGFTVKLTFLFM